MNLDGRRGVFQQPVRGVLVVAMTGPAPGGGLQGRETPAWRQQPLLAATVPRAFAAYGVDSNGNQRRSTRCPSPLRPLPEQPQGGGAQ